MAFPAFAQDATPSETVSDQPLLDGNVIIEIDASGATGTLYAMLHIDAGEIGTWEFPGGTDTPAMAGDQIVTPAFTVTGGLPAVLPKTGGLSAPWFLVLLAAGGLLLTGALILGWQMR